MGASWKHRDLSSALISDTILTLHLPLMHSSHVFQASILQKHDRKISLNLYQYICLDQQVVFRNQVCLLLTSAHTSVVSGLGYGHKYVITQQCWCCELLSFGDFICRNVCLLFMEVHATQRVVCKTPRNIFEKLESNACLQRHDQYTQSFT